MAAEPSQPLRLVDPAERAALAPALLDAGIDTAYQPIVHLGSGSVIAYEALARPRHPDAPNPMVFFQSLEEAGLRLVGERSAFTAAMGGARHGLPRVKLFLNASPLTLVHPDFDVTELLDLAEAHDLSTSDLVVEVTESEAIEDLTTLERRIQRLRRLGIGVAVDDAGAGHASFRVITRLRPSYIKIDRDLVTGVDTDGARRAFIEAMVRFSRQIGSRLIAEGIETEAELACLAGLGVEAGQGYFLARPEIGVFASPSDGSRRMIAAAAQRLRLGAAQVTAGELVRPCVVMSPAATVREAYARFLADPALTLLVIGEGDRLRAQVTRRGLERLLAMPGAWDQLADRPLQEVADHEPLSVTGQLDVVEVAAILAARPHYELSDDVVVTDPSGHILGVAPIRDVLRALAETRHQGEQDIHPLSGMLGKGWIESEIARRLEYNDAVTVLCLDLDGFRSLNDVGGFAFGDDVIRHVGRCLTGVAAGVQGAAAAHVGADDFVLLVSPRRYEELVGEVVRSFESEVVPFIRVELRLRQAHDLADQIGVSIGAVDLAGRVPPGLRYLDWARDLLAMPMRTAKGVPGHACVHRSAEATSITTWTPRSGGQRSIALGLAEPAVVLAALELIDRSWQGWWAGGVSAADEHRLPTAFPGPATLVARLQARYAGPLRAAAAAALAAGEAVMEVTVQGDEEEILELLDRIALVTRETAVVRRLPIPPELSLLDRLLRQRARVITRQDTVTRTEVG
jgi:diguanylate cyclase (GGDEF)-like protein